jgi:hypothetical protein
MIREERFIDHREALLGLITTWESVDLEMSFLNLPQDAQRFMLLTETEATLRRQVMMFVRSFALLTMSEEDFDEVKDLIDVVEEAKRMF